ncbi:MAG: EpsI family protein [Gemmatimonadaceae bacterium]|nr:EpsI family protein [Gemmatimonadaceae bacterium]
MRNWRNLVPAMLFAIGSVLTWGAGRQESAPLDRPLRELPASINGVVGEERPLTNEERQVAGVSDYMFRIFRRDSVNAFSVYVGYYESQATGKTIHSPRNCLPGAGWQVVESDTAALPLDGRTVTVNQYVIANGPMQAVVLYWYQGRGRVAHSEYKVKWELLRDAANRGRTEEALVRVMVPIAPSRSFDATDWRLRREAAEQTARDVAREMLPLMNRALPPWSATT